MIGGIRLRGRPTLCRLAWHLHGPRDDATLAVALRSRKDARCSGSACSGTVAWTSVVVPSSINAQAACSDWIVASPRACHASKGVAWRRGRNCDLPRMAGSVIELATILEDLKWIYQEAARLGMQALELEQYEEDWERVMARARGRVRRGLRGVSVT